ncbi:hypothetical protein RJ639_004625 [Escallonia herrerae]|uniref:Reverse transcriptase domain-containing protein n=1 Tax=Escallonia herrerae TaxID=1293975 RepID=A0AA89AXL8_9ASTE|nr:hypothetical protein RJ639_004625 [Escallonia herrerae]
MELRFQVNNAAISGSNTDWKALGRPTPRYDEIVGKNAKKLKDVVKQSYEEAEACLRTNYHGVKLVTRALVPLLELSDSPRIVNLSSILGQLKLIASDEAKELSRVEDLTEERVDAVVKGYLEAVKEDSIANKGWPTIYSAYIVSKAALNAYTRVMANMCPKIYINAVCPGYVKTDLNNHDGVLTVEEGAKGPVRMALMPDGGPSGMFYNQIEVNNAGVLNGVISDSEVGYHNVVGEKEKFKQSYKMAEACLRTNNYGVNLVARELLPLFELSDSPRIVNVSSTMGQLQIIPSPLFQLKLILQHIPNKTAKKELSDVESLTEERVDAVVKDFLEDVKEGLVESKGWPSSYTAYIVSKAALNAYTRVLAKMHPKISTNAVCPGYVKTDLTNTQGILSAAEGAKAAVSLALMPDSGPSGLFYSLMRKLKKSRQEKPVFGDNLTRIMESFSGPWLGIGDFNEIIASSEKVGGRPFASLSAGGLISVINETELIDLGFSSNSFTWNNKKPLIANIKERIDRGLANPAWRLLFPYASIQHCQPTNQPTIQFCSAQLKSIPNTPNPIKFLACWTIDHTSRYIVEHAWRIPVRGSPQFKLCLKLKNVRRAFKVWNPSHFGNVQSNVKLLSKAIDQIQKEVPDHANLAREANLQITLDEELKEESMWMEKLVIVLMRIFFQHPRALIFPSLNLENVILLVISGTDNWMLCAIPSDSEIGQVLNQMGSNKVSRLDGMASVFYKSYWKTIKTDVINIVKSFFTENHLLKEQNHTYCPYPKAREPTAVSHYRLTSLCNINYKLISKILASRLQSVLNKLVSPLQAAFVLNRLISNNNIIVQELWHTMMNKKGKSGLMAIKIDMEKAYDKMEWAFILAVLENFGFDSRWSGWVNNAGVLNGVINEGEVGYDDVREKGKFIRSYKKAEACLRTNYYGVKQVTRELIPLLELSNSPRIVNVSSTMGQLQLIPSKRVKKELGDVGGLTEEKVDAVVKEFLEDVKEGLVESKGWPSSYTAYIVSKAALNAYTRVLAKNYPRISINAVCPGWVKTDLSNNQGNFTAEEGAKPVVRLALMPEIGSSGLFFNRMRESTF